MELIRAYIVKSKIEGYVSINCVCPMLEKTEIGKKMAINFYRQHEVLETLTMKNNEDEVEVEFIIRMDNRREHWYNRERLNVK